MRFLATITSILLLLAIAGNAQTSRWTPELQLKTRAVGTPRVSPDGKRVVYTVNDAMMAPDKSEFVTQLWLATTDGKENFQVTFNEKSSTNPKWSPEGNSIAFTSNRKDNKNNLYLLRLNGGEAEPLTDVQERGGEFRMVARRPLDSFHDGRRKNGRGRKERQSQE